MAKSTAKSKSTAVAHAKSNIPANWREKLRGLAKQDHERINVSEGNKLSLTKKGTFQYQGADLGESMDVIVLSFGMSKQWYEGDYDKNNPGPPACFALKLDEKNIAPHDTSPNKQAEICADCPQNEWGSGKSASGKPAKACKDKLRMALISVDDLRNADDITQAQVALLELPVTSGATFKKYAKRVTGATELPLWCMVTRLTADADSDWEAIKAPELVEEVPPAMLEGLEALAARGTEMILEPYDVSRYSPGKGAKSARASKKTAVKGNGNGGRSRLSR